MRTIELMLGGIIVVSTFVDEVLGCIPEKVLRVLLC